MVNHFKNTRNASSLSRKLIGLMMLVSCIGVTISVIAMVAIILANQRRAMIDNLESIASIVASNSTAAVTFKDKRATAEILQALRELPAIEFARIHLMDSTVLATYGRRPLAKNWVPDHLPGTLATRVAAGENLADVVSEDVVHVTDKIYLFKPIVLDGERIGALHVISNVGQFWQVGFSGALSGLVVLLLTALLAYMLSRRLQYTVSEPIVNLYRTMVRISDSKDYGLRAVAAKSSGIEEISTLIDGFNEMLSQLQRRESELVSTNVALQTSEERLEGAQEIAGLGYWDWDEERPSRTYVSPRWADFFGASADDLKVPLEAFIDRVHPHDRDTLNTALSNAMRNREGYDIEYRILGSDGEIRHLHERVQYRPPTADDPGRLEGIGQDVTDARMAAQDRQTLTQQLYESQKREALGTLAGGVAHDFNNILAIMTGYTDLALKQLPEDEDAAEHLRQVMRASDRARDLVGQILMYSRTDASRFEGVCVADVLEESLSLLRATIPATIEFTGEIGGKDVWINGNATQIHQIVMNLCVNASHAIGSRHGAIAVQLEEVTGDPTSNIGPVDLADGKDDGVVVLDPEPGSNLTQIWVSRLGVGRYLKLSVGDTGDGIDGNTISRIFDPFFTTRKVGSGTGLGLAAVRGIVVNHGGAIHVETAPGEGTRFSIFLPVSETAAAAAAPEPENLKPGSIRVLCVDDEPELVEINTLTLSGAGHSVDGYTDSYLALEAFRAAPDNWDVVITDYTMPKMTGVELAAQMLEIRDDIPIILCSGFADNVTDEAGGVSAALRLANKPIVGKQLVALIEETVQGAGGRGTGETDS